VSTAGPAVERVVYCHRCLTDQIDERRFYAPFRNGFLCSSCWHELGRNGFQ
jgi:hypothetical protein